MTADSEKQAAEVMKKADAGKELTAAEQRAYDKAVADANDERGYEEFLYHGITMYRIIDAPERTFGNERDAQEWVTHMRVNRNLQG